MRLLLSSLVSAGLLVGGVANAQTCARPTEKAAFDVAGLKSQLMVTAISCQKEELYNAFVMRFRPDLVSQEKQLSSYFSRSFGRRAQSEHDDYITNLANSQSQNGIKAGTGFCTQNVSLFDEVMALKSGTELPTLAAAKNLTQPIALVECSVPAPAVQRTAAVTSRSTARR